MAQQQAASTETPPEPTPPGVDITSTPEFRNAVNDAVQAALEKFLASGASVQSVADDQTAVFRQLALAIGEISDQGTQRKRVAPEILAQRAEAHERAVTLLLKAREQGLMPKYRLTSKVYLKEVLIEPFQKGKDGRPEPTVIRWAGMPNDAMLPLNDVAKAIYKEYCASIGSVEADRKQPAFWMTPEGAVIEGAGPARRAAPGFRDTSGIGPEVETDFGDDLGIIDAADPRAREHRVLGTIAAPATRNDLPELVIGR